MFSGDVNEIAWFGLAFLAVVILGRIDSAVRTVTARLERMDEIQRQRSSGEEIGGVRALTGN